MENGVGVGSIGFKLFARKYSGKSAKRVGRPPIPASHTSTVHHSNQVYDGAHWLDSVRVLYSIATSHENRSDMFYSITCAIRCASRTTCLDATLLARPRRHSLQVQSRTHEQEVQQSTRFQPVYERRIMHTRVSAEAGTMRANMVPTCIECLLTCRCAYVQLCGSHQTNAGRN